MKKTLKISLVLLLIGVYFLNPFVILTAKAQEKESQNQEEYNVELWRGSTKVGGYVEMADAYADSQENDVIKIIQDCEQTYYFEVDKNITIDGNNKKIYFDEHNEFTIYVNDATLTIKNITFTNLIVPSPSAPEQTQSSSNDTIITYKDYPVIESIGTLNMNNVHFSNMNFRRSYESAITILGGTANVKNSTFTNLISTETGTAVIIEGDGYYDAPLDEPQAPARVQYDYTDTQGDLVRTPITATFTNCDFKNNTIYNGGGAGIYALDFKTLNIDKCNFIGNKTVDGYYDNGDRASNMGSFIGGPAMLLGNQTYSTESKVNIKTSKFEKNYADSVSTAIYSANVDMTIDGTTFEANSGELTFEDDIYDESTFGAPISVGTEIFYGNEQSLELREEQFFEERAENKIEGEPTEDALNIKITNSTFKKNTSPQSVFNDAMFLGEPINLEFSDSTVTENEGFSSLEIVGSNTLIKNVTFKNERQQKGIIDVMTPFDDYAPTVTIEGVKVLDSTTPTGLLTKKYLKDVLAHPTINIKGTNELDLEVWDKSIVNITGTLKGDIITDTDSPSKTNIIIKDGGSHIGEIIDHENTKTVIILYEHYDKKPMRAYVYLNNGQTYSQKEIYEMHLIGKDDAMLEYYTDLAHTVKWNYTAPDHMYVPAKWETHTHVPSTYGVKENKIHERCNCGYYMKNLSIKPPTDLSYDGEEKPISVNSQFALEVKDYSIKYQLKTKTGTYTDLEDVPKEKGIYKATLTFNGLTITEEYEIIENPNTADINPFLILSIVIVGTATIIRYGKKKRLF